MNKLTRSGIALGAAALLSLGAPTVASASDWGGYANPNSKYCGGNDVVKTVKLKDRKGNVGGYAALKWSYGCPGNYGLVQSYGGARKVNATVKDVSGKSNLRAGTDETTFDRAWTRVIEVGWDDRVCVYADIYKGFSNTKYSGVVCAG